MLLVSTSMTWGLSVMPSRNKIPWDLIAHQRECDPCLALNRNLRIGAWAMIQTMIHWFLSFIYIPGSPFLEHPERALLIAGGFGLLLAVSVLRAGLLRRTTQVGVVVATCVWILFGSAEQQMQGHGYNIRVDYLFTWPVVLATSVIAIALVLRDLTASQSTRVDNTEKR